MAAAAPCLGGLGAWRRCAGGQEGGRSEGEASGRCKRSATAGDAASRPRSAIQPTCCCAAASRLSLARERWPRSGRGLDCCQPINGSTICGPAGGRARLRLLGRARHGARKCRASKLCSCSRACPLASHGTKRALAIAGWQPRDSPLRFGPGPACQRPPAGQFRKGYTTPRPWRRWIGRQRLAATPAQRRRSTEPYLRTREPA